MLDTISNLIRYLVILIFISTLLEMILPQGVFRRYLRMLVGILLIFALITPLQKIMHLAPYWEMPSLIESRDSEGAGELEVILSRGEQLYRDKMETALEDYQKQVFHLLEGELCREFNYKLLQLRLENEDDPGSKDFGMTENIYAVVRVQEPISRVEPSSGPEKIRVSVNVAPPGLQVSTEKSGVGGMEGAKNLDRTIEAEKVEKAGGAADSGNSLILVAPPGDPIKEIAQYIASFFRLSPEHVHVEILP